jgi:hypothetical protein
MSNRTRGQVLRYQSGDDIQEGDRVTYGGNPAVVELVVSGPSDDENRDWHFRASGPGVMIAEPRVFGRVYLTSPDDEEDLLLVARAE